MRCFQSLPDTDPMPTIVEVAKLHEELFGPDDDELLKAVIEYLAFRTA